ncbi:MAG TPA: DUF1232 domain-containing protein [Bacillota bacterium]|nr:DUF1232 domain-containing protein [Bacillota bacterium]
MKRILSWRDEVTKLKEDSRDYEILEGLGKTPDMRRDNGYYNPIRNKKTRWAESRAGSTGETAVEYILLAPDFLMLLIRLMRDKRVPRRSKSLVAGGLAYYVLPLDFLPEVLLGPIGFADDLVLAVLIINTLIQAEPEVVLSHWSGREELLDTLRRSLLFGEKFLTKSVYGKVKNYFNRLSK